MDFAKETILLKKYLPDPAAAVPAYETYRLYNVMVRETFATGADGKNGDGATVYFLRDVSVCRKTSGTKTALPRLAKGDLCVLHAGTEAETEMRVAEAGYFTGGNLSHIRIKLK